MEPVLLRKMCRKFGKKRIEKLEKWKLDEKNACPEQAKYIICICNQV